MTPTRRRTPSSTGPLAVVIGGGDRPGLLQAVTQAVAAHHGDIRSTHVEVVADRASIYLELEGVDDADALIADITRIDVVDHAELAPSMLSVFGKRIIVIGAGAQVSQVAVGAVGEADRHNIRGEKISVDTFPVVGETNIAHAVSAAARLPRVAAVVLAGSLMGGKISDAVDELRAKGILVVSLNMAGSVPDHADLVVTDPLQAGVMTVMAIASTAKFTLSRVGRRRF
jgi:energy-converting hydrogenase B subunit Q